MLRVRCRRPSRAPGTTQSRNLRGRRRTCSRPLHQGKLSRPGRVARPNEGSPFAADADADADPDAGSFLLDCHVDVCSPEVLFAFSDNFDYQDIRKDVSLSLLVPVPLFHA